MYTSILTVVKNCAPPAKCRNAASLAQFLIAIARAAAPVACGAVFSWSLGARFAMHEYLLFALLALCALFAFFFSMSLPRYLAVEWTVRFGDQRSLPASFAFPLLSSYSASAAQHSGYGAFGSTASASGSPPSSPGGASASGLGLLARQQGRDPAAAFGASAASQERSREAIRKRILHKYSAGASKGSLRGALIGRRSAFA